MIKQDYLTLRKMYEDKNSDCIDAIVYRFLKDLSEYEARQMIVASLVDKEASRIDILRGIDLSWTERYWVNKLSNEKKCLLALNNVTIHGRPVEVVSLCVASWPDDQKKYDFVTISVLYRHGLIAEETFNLLCNYYGYMEGFIPEGTIFNNQCHKLLDSLDSEAEFVGTLAKLPEVSKSTYELGLALLKTPYNGYHDEIVTQLYDGRGLRKRGIDINFVLEIIALIRGFIKSYIVSDRTPGEITDLLATRPDLYKMVTLTRDFIKSYITTGRTVEETLHFADTNPYLHKMVFEEEYCYNVLNDKPGLIEDIKNGRCKHVIFAIAASDLPKESKGEIIHAWIENGLTEYLDTYLPTLMYGGLPTEMDRIRTDDKRCYKRLNERLQHSKKHVMNPITPNK